MKELFNRNIGSQVHYIPVHRQPYHKNLQNWRVEDFPCAELFYSEALSIPLYHDLTDEDVEYVIDSMTSISCN